MAAVRKQTQHSEVACETSHAEEDGRRAGLLAREVEHTLDVLRERTAFESLSVVCGDRLKRVQFLLGGLGHLAEALLREGGQLAEVAAVEDCTEGYRRHHAQHYERERARDPEHGTHANGRRDDRAQAVREVGRDAVAEDVGIGVEARNNVAGRTVCERWFLPERREVRAVANARDDALPRGAHEVDAPGVGSGTDEKGDGENCSGDRKAHAEERRGVGREKVDQLADGERDEH